MNKSKQMRVKIESELKLNKSKLKIYLKITVRSKYNSEISKKKENFNVYTRKNDAQVTIDNKILYQNACEQNKVKSTYYSQKAQENLKLKPFKTFTPKTQYKSLHLDMQAAQDTKKPTKRKSSIETEPEDNGQTGKKERNYK